MEREKQGRSKGGRDGGEYTEKGMDRLFKRGTDCLKEGQTEGHVDRKGQMELE